MGQRAAIFFQVRAIGGAVCRRRHGENRQPGGIRPVANIANEVDSCYAPTLPADGGPPGDLNAGLPTAAQQEARAAASYPNAELVLIDGCINDVGAERIALPFPLSRATPMKLNKLAHHWCSDYMLSLLKSTASDFPHATIIVSNYWLIISDKSSPIGLALGKDQVNFTPKERAEYRDVRDLLKAELKAEKEAGEQSTDVKALSDPKMVLRKWSDNSKAFLDTSEACFDWAVATVDGRRPRPTVPIAALQQAVWPRNRPPQGYGRFSRRSRATPSTLMVPEGGNGCGACRIRFPAGSNVCKAREAVRYDYDPDQAAENSFAM